MADQLSLTADWQQLLLGLLNTHKFIISERWGQLSRVKCNEYWQWLRPSLWKKQQILRNSRTASILGPLFIIRNLTRIFLLSKPKSLSYHSLGRQHTTVWHMIITSLKFTSLSTYPVDKALNYCNKQQTSSCRPHRSSHYIKVTVTGWE